MNAYWCAIHDGDMLDGPVKLIEFDLPFDQNHHWTKANIVQQIVVPGEVLRALIAPEIKKSMLHGIAKKLFDLEVQIEI